MIPRRRTWKQINIPWSREVPQELLFTAMESKELGESFEGDRGDSGDDLPEEGDRLAMVVSPPPSNAWGSATDIATLQSNVLALLSSLQLLHCMCSLTGFLLVQTCYLQTPPHSCLSIVMK